MAVLELRIVLADSQVVVMWTGWLIVFGRKGIGMVMVTCGLVALTFT